MGCVSSMSKFNCLIVAGCVVIAGQGFASLAFGDESSIRQDAIIVRAVERMKDYDYTKNADVKAAISRHIERSKGTPEYLKLLKQFRPDGLKDKLRSLIFAGDNSSAVEAANMLLNSENGHRDVRPLVQSKDTEQAKRMAAVLGLLGDGRSVWLLSELAKDAEKPYDLRRIAVGGMAKNRHGQQTLLELVRKKELVGDTHLVAGALLARSQDAAIRDEAGKLLPMPAAKDQKPLPPIDALAQIKGNVDAGLKMFRDKGTCANCHVVGKHGKEVGPNLSEIGSKLSREAMITSILAPSAGISHNYENFSVLTDSGQVIVGLKVSETPTEVVIRTAEAIDRKISTDEIEEIKKSEKSIMPENLHHLTGQQGLIDVVEYMMSLKKK